MTSEVEAPVPPGAGQGSLDPDPAAHSPLLGASGPTIAATFPGAVPFSWTTTREENRVVHALAGSVMIAAAPEVWKRVTEELDNPEEASAESVNLDLSGIAGIDGACLALLVHLQTELKRRRIPSEFVGVGPEFNRLLRLHRHSRLRRRSHLRPRGTLDQIGEATASVLLVARSTLSFLGEFLITFVRLVRHPTRIHLRDVTLTMERAGADAVPIVALINFLIGFVMAYQSAAQLEQFGAGIFVADLVGLAMVRELGPLMTAIIVCGRSGAAFAAELGTMKVSEEVDALRTLGLMPLAYLVLPRVLGLVLVVPLLTLMADAVGIAGGMLVGIIKLDLTGGAFLAQLKGVLRFQDIASGLLKSSVFGFAIAFIACERGLSATGGAAEVGRRTTSAVVTTLFALILLDAVFTVVLEAVRL